MRVWQWESPVYCTQTPCSRACTEYDQCHGRRNPALRPAACMCSNDFAYEDIELGDVTLKQGKKSPCAGGPRPRSPALYSTSSECSTLPVGQAHAGPWRACHFCVGAPLARLEMQTRCVRFLIIAEPQLAEAPRFANTTTFTSWNG